MPDCGDPGSHTWPRKAGRHGDGADHWQLKFAASSVLPLPL